MKTTLSKNIGLAAFAITGSLLMGLLLSEFLLRVLGVYATYNEKNNLGGYVSQFTSGQNGWLNTYRPNQQLVRSHTEFKHEVASNSVGANDREWPLKKQKALRIACLGDSFTDGVGAPRDSTYPAQLQVMLDSAEVFNGGIAGNDPFWAYMFLKQTLIAYAPDIVLFSINSSDIFETINRGGFQRFSADGNVHFVRRAPWWEPLYAHSYIIRLLIHKVFGYSRYLISNWSSESALAIKQLNNCLDSTSTLCAQNGIRCVFVFNPLAYEMSNDTLECKPVQDYAKQHGYQFVNVHQYFKSQGVNKANQDKYFWPNDTHNTPLGYTLFAQAVVELLATNIPKTKIPAGERGF